MFTLTLILSAISVLAYQGNRSDKKIIYLRDDGATNKTIFSDDIKLAPGDNLTKEFYVDNNNDFNCSINNIIIDGQLYDKNGQLMGKNSTEYSNFMNDSNVIISCDGKEIFKDKLKSLIDTGLSYSNKIFIDKNNSRRFEMSYSLDGASDNTIMGMEYKFDVKVSYSSLENDETIDKGVSGINLPQMGYFFDTKILVSMGIFICCIGITFIFSSRVAKKIE